jgi:hypothetical protein
MARANLPEQLALARTPVTIGRFQVFRSRNDLYQSETEVDPLGDAIGHSTYKFEYAVGSGTRGRPKPRADTTPGRTPVYYFRRRLM